MERTRSAPRRTARPRRTADSDRTRGVAPAAPRGSRPKKILLASVGPPISDAMIRRVVEVAAGFPDRPAVIVFSVARIWGTRLGLPNPGLYPNRREMEEQRQIVRDAADALRRKGFEVHTRVGSARGAGKAIGWEAQRAGCHAIVVGDPMTEAKRWERLLKGDEANQVARYAKVPVHVVPIPAPDPRARGVRLRTIPDR